MAMVIQRSTFKVRLVRKTSEMLSLDRIRTVESLRPIPEGQVVRANLIQAVIPEWTSLNDSFGRPDPSSGNVSPNSYELSL